MAKVQIVYVHVAINNSYPSMEFLQVPEFAEQRNERLEHASHKF